MRPTAEQVKQAFEEFEVYLRSCLEQEGSRFKEPRESIGYSYKFVWAMECFTKGYNAAHKLHDPEDYAKQINGQ